MNSSPLQDSTFDPRDVQLQTRREDSDAPHRFRMTARLQQRRLIRTVILWLVAMLFLFLAAIVIARLG
jgi:hypothetical protein